MAGGVDLFKWQEVLCRYVSKLRKQLEDACAEIFPSAQDQERVKSVLSDLAKTAADFKQIVARAAETFVAGLMPRVRYTLKGSTACSLYCLLPVLCSSICT